MAQQRQKEQFEDPLGSIFDFIFSQSQQPPSKVKPAKVTGIDGTSEFADALVATLENPLLFVNDTTMEAFQEGLDIDLVKVKFGDRDQGIKFNLQDIGAIVKDPGKFIDKQFNIQESIRKSQKLAHSGEMMRAVVAGTWATKKGLDRDTRNAMMSVSRPQAFRADMMTRSDKLMEEHFVRGTKEIKKSQLISRYGATKGKDLFKLYQKAKVAYQSGDPKEKRDIYAGGSINELYSILEGEEISQKWRSASSIEEKAKYRHARQFVDNMTVLASTPNDVLDLRDKKQDIKEFFNKSKEEIAKRERYIANLRRQGASPREIAKQRRMVKNIESDMKMARNYDYASRLGQYEGYWNTTKELFVEGKLLPNVINGKFFDAGRNRIPRLQPSMDLGDPRYKKATTRKFRIKTRSGKVKEGEVQFHRGKVTGNKFLDNYYEGMNGIYYLSPVTWARSLSTGEIFAYRAHRVEEMFKKRMGEELTRGLSGFDLDDFLKQVRLGNGEAYIARWRTVSNRRVQELLGKAENFIGKEQRLHSLTYRFSAISRMKESASKWINEKIGVAEIREKIGNKLLQIGFVKKFSSTAVNSWIKNGGLYGLVKGVVSAGLQAVGVSVGGPIGSAVAAAITWVATEVIIKATKPIIKVSVKVVILSVLGFIGLFVLLFGSFHMMTFSKYSHVAPDQVKQCDAYYNLGLLPVGDGLGPNCKIGVSLSGSTLPTKSVVVDILNRWTAACPMGSYPEVCYEDVYCRALKYGIDPAFAMSIWSNESGGSNYAYNSEVEDFGIHGHPDVPVANFDKQIEFFLENIAQPRYIEGCSWDSSYQPQGSSSKEMIMWGAKFLTGGCSSASNLQQGEGYIDQIKEIYGWYTGKTLAWPFTSSGGGASCDYSGATVNTAYNSCEVKGAQGWGAGGGSEPVDIPEFTPGNLPPGQQCLFERGPNLDCTQGPYSYCSKDPEYINHYRPSHLNSPAIDVGVGGNFHAPTFCNRSSKNCKVISVGQGTCGGSNKYPAGGFVIFTAEHGGREYQFYVLHVAIGVSTGEYLGSGQPVATISDSPDWRMCSSGLHAHLTVQVNGSYVDAQAAMDQDFQCNVGYCERDQCWPRN